MLPEANINVQIFFKLLFGCPTVNFDHSRMDSLTNPILITAFSTFFPEGHREPCYEVGSRSPAERLVEFEPGTFQFFHCNALTH